MGDRGDERRVVFFFLNLVCLNMGKEEAVGNNFGSEINRKCGEKKIGKKNWGEEKKGGGGVNRTK